MERRFERVVVKATGSWYTVLLRDGNTPVGGDGEEVRARLRGRLRLSGARSTNPVVVGDVVECFVEKDGGEIWIERILPRRNYIIRRASNLSKESHIIAANIDRAMVVATLVSPVVSTEFIDRFLVTCEAYGIPATVVLNKVDLLADRPEEVDRFTEIYTSAGYPVMAVSSVTGEGKTAFYTSFNDKTTLLAGNSGVGKSTLVKGLVPDAEIRIGDVSTSNKKGMHTTTFSQMYPIPEGGFIIDTPGIKGFGLIDISPAELARYFPDLARFSPDCGYHNCTHTHEPDCAVRRAVESGDIAEERYVSYLKMLEEDGKHR